MLSLGKECSLTLCYTSLQYFWMCEDEKGLFFWLLQTLVFRSGTETQSAKTAIKDPGDWPAWQDAEWQGVQHGQAVWDWLWCYWPAAWQGQTSASPWECSPFTSVSPGQLRRIKTHRQQREHPGQPPQVSLGSDTSLSKVRRLQSPLSERGQGGDVWDSHKSRWQLPLLLV